MSKPKIDWGELDYGGFSNLARDERLSKYEKIGFPDAYREGHEETIFRDIRSKLTRIEERDRIVVDIGPGCSDLPLMLIEHCRLQGDRLVLVDSPEMLSNLPDGENVRKVAGPFPQCRGELEDLRGKVDVLLCYSVFHYVFVEGNPFAFVDAVLDLLAPGGQCLIGDIPNISKRRRFFSSEAGIAFHRAFTGEQGLPKVEANVPVERVIDDAVMLGIMMRVRAAGADAYVMPQPDSLPMANRREDLLIRRP
jgi:hypothetical protein